MYFDQLTDSSLIHNLSQIPSQIEPLTGAAAQIGRDTSQLISELQGERRLSNDEKVTFDVLRSYSVCYFVV